LFGFNDLQTTNPELANQAHGWDPKTIIAGTNKKLEWKCSQGHIWKASGNSRISKKSGCPYCANTLLLKNFNDLATTHPELAKEAHGWDPKTIIAGTHKKFEWVCSQGHVWSAAVNSRSGNKRNCPYCSNQKLLVGFNDLQTTNPELANQAHGWDPKTIIAGTNKKLEWKCSQGHVWKANANSRANSERGCPSCAQTGFDPNQNGYVYFLIQPKWEIYQIGISNFPNNRLKSHKKNGFELLELRGPMDGHTAQELETALLRFLKSQKADLSPEHIAGKFDGYSESWTIDSFQINSLKELIDRTREAGY
jgi:glutaredoxin